MAKLFIRYYRRSSLRLGPVSLDVYTLDRVEERSGGDVFDVYADVAERYKSTPGVAVEIVREESERGVTVEREVAMYTADGGEVLFHRPARLLRLVLVPPGEADTGPNGVEVDKLPAYRPSGEVYVFLGSVRSEKPAWGVLLETDKGSRMVILSARGMKKDSNSEPAR